MVPPAVVGLAAIIGWLVPTHDFLVMPGDALNTGNLVAVTNAPDHPNTGHFFLVTVYTAPANLDEWLFGHIFPHARLAPAQTQVPPNTSFPDYQRVQARMMTDSQTTAKVVALQLLGYTVTYHGKGALIQQVGKDTPAALAGLNRGDLVTAINDQPVETADQMVSQLRTFGPGAQIGLTVTRPTGQQAGQVPLTLGPRPDDPKVGYVGVSLGTDSPTYDFPVDVKIDSKGIIGPSAGLVLTLQIIQKLSPTDITHGKNIAATGTIQPDGSIGAIGDVGEKVIAAEGQAQYFLAPKDNFAEAQKEATKIKVVQVDTVKQAMDFLNSLS